MEERTSGPSDNGPATGWLFQTSESLAAWKMAKLFNFLKRKKWYFIKFIHKVIFEELILHYFECRPNFQSLKDSITYRKVVSSNMSRLDAHAGFFRLLIKGIFDPYLL